MALLVLLYIALLPYIEGQFRKTDSCPSGIFQWKRREALFPCPPETPYHCILVYNTSQLYEACMVARTIQPGKVGCPWILFYKDRPVLGSKNSECPVTNPDCPPGDHRGYLTNQLYQYPMCFIHRSTRKSQITEINTRIPSTTFQPEENLPSSSGNFGIWIVVLVVFTISAIIGLIAFLLRNKIKEKCTAQQGSKDVTEHEKERFIKGGEVIIPHAEEKERFIKDRDIEGTQITIHHIVNHIDVKKSNEDVQSTSLLQKHQIDVRQSNEDAKTTSPSLQQPSGMKHPVQDVPSSTPRQQHQSDMKQSNEDAKPTSPSHQQSSGMKHPEHDINVQQSDYGMEFETSSSKKDLSYDKPVVKFSEDIVRDVFCTILQFDNGIAEYYTLLQLLLKKELLSVFTSQNLEDLLRCNSTLFRLLEDSDGILFVIAYSSLAKTCEIYNGSWQAGQCTKKNCGKFHVCLCRKPDCQLSHSYSNAHNHRLKKSIHLNEYSDNEMNIILLNQYPKVCSIRGCEDNNDCPYLHMCLKFCNGKCNDESRCPYGHSFDTDHNIWILGGYGIPVRELWSGNERTKCFSSARNKKQKI